MVYYPSRGLSEWDDDLKAYLDEHHAALNGLGEVPDVQLPDRLSESGLNASYGAELETPGTPLFIAAENRAALSEIVVSSYYGDTDQLAVEGAIDRAVNQGGGTVVLPVEPVGGGVNGWRLSQILLPKFVALRGLNWCSFGDAGSRITQLSGVNDDLIRFDDGGQSSPIPWAGPAQISDLILLGNVTSTAGHGIAGHDQDDQLVKWQDLVTIERVLLAYFAGSGIYVPGGSPCVISDVVTFWNGGFGIELEDTGYDTSNIDLHHVSLENISGDGNMGYEADGYGATVRLKGHRDSSGVTMRGIKGEYRRLPVFAGGDDIVAGNFHSVIIEDCDSDIDLAGITTIASGSYTRRPGPPVLVTGNTRRPGSLRWSGVGLRGHHPTQTDDPVNYTRVRDETQGATVDYLTGYGELGTQVDAAAVPDLTTGQSTIPMDGVNTAAGGWSTATGNMRLAYFTAKRTELATTVRSIVSAAAVGTTLARYGLYEVDADGDLTLVASTPDDDALWSATGTQSKALSAPYRLKKNQRYAWGILWTGATTPPGMASQGGGLSAAELAKSPRKTGLVTGLSDLPSSVSAGTVGDTSLRFYVAFE